MAEAKRPTETVRRFVLVILAIGISILFLTMIRAFIVALLLAAIFAALSHPLYRRLLGLFRGRRYLASAAVVVVLLLAVIGPLTGLVGILVTEAVNVSRSVRPWVEEQVRSPGEFLRWLERAPMVNELVPDREALFARAGELVGRTAGFVTDAAAAGTRGTARFFLMLFVMLYALFYFLIDGKAVLDRLLYYLPLSNDDEGRMLDRFTSVTRATLKGTLLIGLIQGLLGGGAFAVASIPGSVLWGTVMAVLSIIPGVGIALVWVPAAAYLALSGRIAAAVLFTLWCAGVAGTADNVLRPRLVGQDAKMSDLLILVSTLGGLALFGAVGILVGPLVAALFVTIWDLYGQAFADLLPPTGAEAPAVGFHVGDDGGNAT